MAQRNQNFKAIKNALKEAPDELYTILIKGACFTDDEQRILDLLYRKKLDRIETSYKLSLSLSCLDRKHKSIIKRLEKYSLHMLKNMQNNDKK